MPCEAHAATRGDDFFMIESPRVVGETMEIAWHPESRLAVLRFQPGITLGAREGTCLVDTLTSWIGADGQPFGLLAETQGVRGADSPYRVKTRDFFKQHRDNVFVAVTGMGAVIRVVAEMFRIGTGIQLRGFADEPRARAWLRRVGIAA
jgi:hypothetical protein